MKEYKAILIAMSGVRVYNSKLMELGLTLPGFVERRKVIASLPSLGLISIAAYTPPNWDIEYREIDEIDEDAIQKLIDAAPDVVAFSSLTARILDTYRIADRLRLHGITVVIGGLHATALPNEAHQHADAVIQGEGELIWTELLRDHERGELRPFYSSLTENKFKCDFESYKTPRFDLLDIRKYNRLTLQTTRGCPLHCSFCAASRMISSYKKKPIHLIEQEINAILELWDKPFIELADDNTFVDKKWTKDLLRLLNRYNIRWFTETDVSVGYDEEVLDLLADSSCAQLLIGFEATNRNSLDHIDAINWKYKQFDQYHRVIESVQSRGVSVNGCFIFGFDSDTVDTFEVANQFISNSNLSEVQITLLTPFPGTTLYDQLKRENRLL